MFAEPRAPNESTVPLEFQAAAENILDIHLIFSTQTPRIVIQILGNFLILRFTSKPEQRVAQYRTDTVAITLINRVILR